MRIREYSSVQDPEFRRAVALLLEGGVAIYPTETFYALGGDPENAAPVKRIFEIKGRDFDKPLPLIAARRASISRVVSAWPESADRLADAFWPGPLSLLLPAADSISPLIHAYTGKLAIRISPHPVAAALADALRGLILSTSANFSGEPACRNLEELPEELKDGVDIVISGGLLTGGLPSTIVDVTITPPRLVRKGPIAWEAIQQILDS
jgi:L-threonylcarbamoyladenylate synthase